MVKPPGRGEIALKLFLAVRRSWRKNGVACFWATSLEEIIGGVKDGKVTAFSPEPSVEAGAPEGIGVDDAGNVYAGWTAKMAVRRYVQ